MERYWKSVSLLQTAFCEGDYMLMPQMGHPSKRFDKLDHSTTLIGIGQRAAHRAGVVRHMTGIAGPRNYRGHTRIAEQVLQEKLSP
jgi:hypothetical protein